MKKLILSIVGVALLAAAGTTRAGSQAAQSAPPAQSADKTPPSYDMKPQSLLDLETINKKFISLAEAIPADKFTWRPANDTRSFAELFLHVAGERYGFLSLMGAAPPPEYDPKTFGKSTTDKAKIIEELNKSWQFTQTTIQGMTNSDFAKALPKLGPDANEGDVIYLLVVDAHEHLGQAIAYSRVNGIVPPWTADAAAAAAAKKAQQQKQ
ncbi:MAG TPA: DinB family protein [Candidatus Acidoferrales bacterium]|nr:DinB family protein [Candidatus Acidoferrales bacterium]